MKKPLMKKYAPKNTEEIVGQEKIISQLLNFIKNYKVQKKRAIILYGGTGIGKTSSVHALANELNLELVELNASDFRNEEGIRTILGTAMNQQSLFCSSKLILVDEVDGISGTKDRGGIVTLQRLIEKSTYPVILTANDIWNKKFSGLRQKSELIHVKELDHSSIVKILKNICKSEKIEFDEEAITSIARRAGGDARAAINDLQIISELNKSVKKGDLDALSDREREETIHNALMKVFKTKKADVSLGSFNYVNMDVREIMLWLDENLPKEYSKEDLATAYYYLSRADQFNGRIRRRQHWRFLAYIMQFLTAGISLSKKEKNSSFVKYAPTKRILKIWQMNMKNAKRKEIAKKIAKKTHISSREAIKNLPFIKQMFKNKNERENLINYFKFDVDEVKWMVK